MKCFYHPGKSKHVIKNAKLDSKHIIENFMEKKITKKYKRKPTLKQVTAIRLWVESGGKRSIASIGREAGYSEATIKNPNKITRSYSMQKAFEEAGINDNLLAKTHSDLIGANKIESKEFLFARKGKKLIPWTDDQIEQYFKRLKGAEIISIVSFPDRKMVDYSIPESMARKDALNLAYKVKGDFVADRALDDLMHHVLEEKEARELDFITKRNKKGERK
jgi:hypothetical protein